MELLSKRGASAVIKRHLATKPVTGSGIIDRLRVIADGNVNDAMFLMTAEENLSKRGLEMLDLSCVSSISRSPKTGYKVEFYDKVKVLKLLYDCISREDESRGLETFISALNGTGEVGNSRE